MKGKIFIVVMVSFLLGVLSFWGYNQYQTILKKDQAMKKIENSIPSNTEESIVPTSTPIPPSPKPTSIIGGTIEGILGYPSEQVPPLEVYAFDSENQTKFYKIKTNSNQSSFKINDIVPGIYFVVAYSENLSGGYSQMVPCGLSVECTDHSLISVKVKSGESTTGIEVRDWYAPEGSFPAKPL